MNDKDTGRSGSRNPELDDLLSEFFQSEMPEELQNPDRLFRTAAERPSRRRRRQTGLMGIFAATALLLFVVSFLWKPFEPQEEKIAQNTPAQTEISTAAPVIEERLAENNGELVTLRSSQEARLVRDLTEMETMNFERFLMYGDELSAEYTEVVNFERERYETPTGPVEQRNTVYVSTKTVADPTTGNGLVLSIPELEIIVFPVDENNAEDKDGETEK